jgi:hypothetical protein
MYLVSKIGQGAAQVVTFATTAGLGAWVLQHIIPAAWGIYVAVPLGILFACLVELVKRTTLAIAAKHLLKYRTFGAVGVVALAVMLISIGAALLGAKELPEVIFPKPQRVPDAVMVSNLTTDIERVNKDLDRTTGRRALARLQTQRADLINRRDAAALNAGKRADAEHADALGDRATRIEKMQTYSVGATIVAESVFLAATIFILYYLFRQYAESNQVDAAKDPVHRVPTENPEGVSTSTPANGQYNTVRNFTYRPETISATIPAEPRARDNALRYEGNAVDKSLKPCLECGELFRPKTTWQVFCKPGCKLVHHEAKHGAPFDPKKYRHRSVS